MRLSPPRIRVEGLYNGRREVLGRRLGMAMEW
jgi:hypothetical protein